MIRIFLVAGALSLFCVSGCVARAAVGTVGTVAKAGTKAASLTTRAAIGTVKLGARGANAVLTDTPRISKRTLRTYAAKSIGARRSDVHVSQIYEDSNRTDFVATVGNSRRGTEFNCAIIEVDGDLSDAVCEIVIDR